MLPTNPNMEPKEIAMAMMDWDGNDTLGTMVIEIQKDTIIIHLPQGAYGEPLLPSIAFEGYCPVCMAYTMGAHMIKIKEIVEKQYNVCLSCLTEFRPNPLIFPQAIVLYDQGLDDRYMTNLPPEYIESIRKAVKSYPGKNRGK